MFFDGHYILFVCVCVCVCVCACVTFKITEDTCPDALNSDLHLSFIYYWFYLHSSI